MKTNLVDLDIMIDLRPGTLMVVASRPGMGKTSLVRQIALNCAALYPESSQAFWDLYKAPFTEYSVLAHESPDDLTDNMIRQKKCPKLLVIDSIEMFSIGKDAFVERADLVRRLKLLAAVTNSVIILTSNINSSVDKLPTRRPGPSNIDDRYALMEVADIVIALLRRDYYDPLDKPGKCELIICKNRGGRLGSVFTEWASKRQEVTDIFDPFATM